jgi:hypothetical protein
MHWVQGFAEKLDVREVQRREGRQHGHGEIGFFMIFPEFLLEVGFLHKNETPEQFC